MDTEQDIEEQVAPEESTQEEETQNEGTTGANIFNALYDAAEEEPQPEEATVQHTQGQDVEEPPKKKVKKIHKKEVIDPDIPEPEQPTKAAQPAPAQRQRDPFIDELLPEEKDQLRVAQYVAKKSGKAEDRKLYEFFKKQKDYIDGRLKDDPDIDLRDDHEYQSFVSRERPDITQMQMREAEREMVIEEAERRALKRLSPKIQQQEQQAKRAQTAPEVNQLKEQASERVFDIVPEQMAEQFKTNTPEEIQASNPYEYEIVNTAITNASQFASTFIDLSKGMERFDEQNQSHALIRDWLAEEQDQYINSGQTKDESGRPFMRRERYYQLPPEQQASYWTWTDDQIIGLMYDRAKGQMSEALEDHQKKLSAYGKTSGLSGQLSQQAPASSPRPIRSTPRAGGTPASQSPPAELTPVSILGM